RVSVVARVVAIRATTLHTTRAVSDPAAEPPVIGARKAWIAGAVGRTPAAETRKPGAVEMMLTAIARAPTIAAIQRPTPPSTAARAWWMAANATPMSAETPMRASEAPEE